MSTQPAEPVIVVGVDGSAPSKDALRWAARYAELTGAAVHALIAWQASSTPAAPSSSSDSHGQGGAIEAVRQVASSAG
ncbi:MAG: universal stress protein [Micromonosporaceae bacterium]